MPPKTVFTKEDVIDAAFKLAGNNGLKSLTARNVASEMKSSTAPVYSYFKSMKALEKEIIKRGHDMLLEYTRGTYTNIIFLNMGVGAVVFAQEHKMLFRSLFLEPNANKKVLDIIFSELSEDLKRDPMLSDLPLKVKKLLLKKMWIFTHGLSSLVCFDLLKENSRLDIVKFLYSVGSAVIAETYNPIEKHKIINKGKGVYHFEIE